MKDDLPLNGHLRIREKDALSGMILHEKNFDEHNVITLMGISKFIERTTQGNTGTSWIETIYLGDDVGSGNLLNPEEEKDTFTGATQHIVYEVPINSISITYPDPFTFEVSTVLNGTNILDSNFPGDIELRFTSASVRFSDGDVFSYKRFPVRSLSRLVDIELNWTISFNQI